MEKVKKLQVKASIRRFAETLVPGTPFWNQGIELPNSSRLRDPPFPLWGLCSGAEYSRSERRRRKEVGGVGAQSRGGP